MKSSTPLPTIAPKSARFPFVPIINHQVLLLSSQSVFYQSIVLCAAISKVKRRGYKQWHLVPELDVTISYHVSAAAARTVWPQPQLTCELGTMPSHQARHGSSQRPTSLSTSGNTSLNRFGSIEWFTFVSFSILRSIQSPRIRPPLHFTHIPKTFRKAMRVRSLNSHFSREYWKVYE